MKGAAKGAIKAAAKGGVKSAVKAAVKPAVKSAVKLARKPTQASAGRKSKKKVARPARTAPRPAAQPVASAKKPRSTVARPRALKPVEDAAPRVARKSPAVERERRTWDENVVPGPPSSLDLDRTASAARSGRREMLERYANHTETSPALTGGDIDANWESAYSVGDEAPGGDTPTPDQDLVDDIGHAVGLEYEDNEELHSEDKLSDRDRHRWELDPASAEDFKER